VCIKTAKGGYWKRGKKNSSQANFGEPMPGRKPEGFGGPGEKGEHHSFGALKGQKQKGGHGERRGARGRRCGGLRKEEKTRKAGAGGTRGFGGRRLGEGRERGRRNVEQRFSRKKRAKCTKNQLRSSFGQSLKKGSPK